MVSDFGFEEVTYGDSSSGFGSLHLQSEFVELETTTRPLAVATLLLSGFCQVDFSVRVADGGCILHVTVTWPYPLQ